MNGALHTLSSGLPPLNTCEASNLKFKVPNIYYLFFHHWSSPLHIESVLWMVETQTELHCWLFRFSQTDLVFLCVFPVLFLVFNIAYWTAIYCWRWGDSSNINWGSSQHQKEQHQLNSLICIEWRWDIEIWFQLVRGPLIENHKFSLLRNCLVWVSISKMLLTISRVQNSVSHHYYQSENISFFLLTSQIWYEWASHQRPLQFLWKTSQIVMLHIYYDM